LYCLEKSHHTRFLPFTKSAHEPHFGEFNPDPDRLSLAPQERRNFIINHLAPILKKYAAVSIEFYDAEAYTMHCSDIALLKTDTLSDYATMMDDLRKSRLFLEPYFELLDIIPTMEADYLSGT